MAQPARLEVRLDTRELARFARSAELWARDQLPFATAAALTDTARDARDRVRIRLGDAFELRNKNLGNAIAHEPARKRDRPIQALVGVRPWAQFLVPQSLGGLKRAEGGGRVAVPTRAVQRGSTGRVPSRYRPRTLRDRKSLAAGLLQGRGLIALRRRQGLEVYYTLVEAARIRARWPFLGDVEDAVRENLGRNFQRRAEQALTTAR